jgi:agmatine/peptidylarginine deiminase
MLTSLKILLKTFSLFALLTWTVFAPESGLCSRTIEKLSHFDEQTAQKPYDKRREFTVSKIGTLRGREPFHKIIAARRRLPAEFEPQQALLISGGSLLNEAPDLILKIMQRTSGRIGQIVMISNDDDFVPEALAKLLDLPVDTVPLDIDGGNLLSNGSGLAIITTQIFDDNLAFGYDESTVIDIIKQRYGFEQLVILEPLIGEEAGHVDMFATFTAPDTVVVGAYNRRYDPKNAELLDRNASILANTVINNSRLKVVRIPMPPHENGIWRTYTNVIYANGIVLVPVYSTYYFPSRVRALNTFARLLPGWEIFGIDSSKLIENEGALHCISMNLFHVGGRIQFRNGLRYKHPDYFRPKQLTWSLHTKPYQPFQPLHDIATFIEDINLYGVIKHNITAAMP